MIIHRPMPNVPAKRPHLLTSLLQRFTQKTPPAPAAPTHLSGAQVCGLILSDLPDMSLERLMLLADLAAEHYQRRSGEALCSFGDRSPETLELKVRLGGLRVHSRCRSIPGVRSELLRDTLEHVKREYAWRDTEELQLA